MKTEETKRECKVLPKMTVAFKMLTSKAMATAEIMAYALFIEIVIYALQERQAPFLRNQRFPDSTRSQNLDRTGLRFRRISEGRGNALYS